MPARLAAPVVLAALLSGCATAPPQIETPASALELRAFQTHVFEGRDELTAIRAVLQALQDAGFGVVTAEHELGMISFSKETNRGGRNGTLNAIFWYPYLIPFRGLLPKQREFLKVDITATVQGLGDRVRIRLNAELRVHDQKHRLEKVEPVREARFYQELFVAIDKALFLDEAGL